MGFRSLNEGAIDTTNATTYDVGIRGRTGDIGVGGRYHLCFRKLIFNIFSALAHFERRLIQERTKAGLVAARARGRNGGRPKLSADEAKVLLSKKLHKDQTFEIDDICKTPRISRSTFYRYVRM